MAIKDIARLEPITLFVTYFQVLAAQMHIPTNNHCAKLLSKHRLDDESLHSTPNKCTLDATRDTCRAFRVRNGAGSSRSRVMVHISFINDLGAESLKSHPLTVPSPGQ